jgi:two-component system, NarL family, sensor histidine kinase UhpB
MAHYLRRVEYHRTALVGADGFAAPRAQEEERTRIARELHDEVGQTLSALKIDVSCLTAVPVEPDGLRKRGSEMARHLDNAIRCVRTACTDLRVPLLEDFGLAAAITCHLKRIQERTGLRCRARLDRRLPSLGQALSMVVYRVLQEAVRNVVRHARARTIRVSLRRSGDHVVLSVRDDGRGFSPSVEPPTDSFGILGIRERVRFWGGHSEFRSVAGQGTTVVVRVPIPTRTTSATPPSTSLARRAAVIRLGRRRALRSAK